MPPQHLRPSTSSSVGLLILVHFGVLLNVLLTQQYHLIAVVVQSSAALPLLSHVNALNYNLEYTTFSR
ncbi:hypothetical protein BC939DRAFT_447521 [Gamsiella multidivaricata]|uniref:uncharacterized protein n=1 Tax=Gamsiella multidivaricata TaxID=101098 RepID=UPI00221E6456|nr:uncharacterized protein BC939DRAFT_447521 [Gamsiella multidivaricata]KAI7826010.1 hypothetical protein BC939DRAFT_447521 [Gamsiella multidivaricata]